MNQHVCIIRTEGRLDHRFLTCCLSAPWGQDQIFSSFTGASRQGLGQRDLGAIQIPLPRRAEQQRIAAYLDASCSAIDAAVAAKRRQLETLDAVRESVIERAVTRGLNPKSTLRVIARDWIGALPEHWTAVRIKRVISRLDYGISVSTETEGKYPVLKMGNIQSGEIVFSKMEFVNEVADELLELKRLVTIIETQIATLTAYRKSLIHECVTGQLRVGG